MTASRNTSPADAFDVLRRLYSCNWKQLSERLGVTENTLRKWREEGPGTNGAARMAALFQTATRAAGADWMALPINYDRIDTIAGKR